MEDLFKKLGVVLLILPSPMLVLTPIYLVLISDDLPLFVKVGIPLLCLGVTVVLVKLAIEKLDKQ
ncbi:hypothetical protein ACFLQ2_00535 [archaeon]